jgi:hypothetical protein
MSLFDTFWDFLRLFKTGFWECARGRKPKVYFFFTAFDIFQKILPGRAVKRRNFGKGSQKTLKRVKAGKADGPRKGSAGFLQVKREIPAYPPQKLKRGPAIFPQGTSEVTTGA